MTQPALVPLEALMVKRGGSVDPSRFPDEEFDLYSIPAYDSGKPEVLRGDEIGSSKQIIEPGDLLLSRIVPHIRRAWVVGENLGRRLIGSGEWIIFRSPRAHPRYLRHAVVADHFHSQFMGTVAGVGGSLLRARPAQVAKISIPLPSLAEQKRIAAVLDKADDLRTKRRQALATLDTLLQSVFLDMFGDFKDGKKWPRQPLGSLVSSTQLGLVRASELFGEDFEYPYIRMNAITSAGELDLPLVKRTDATAQEVAQCSLAPGDLLFNTRNSRELVGKTAVFEGEGVHLFNNNIMRIRFGPKVDPYFVLRYLHTPVGDASLEVIKAGTTSVFAIYWSKLKDLPIPVPPADLQARFREVAGVIERKRAKARECIMRFDNLFASLQSAAFAGTLFPVSEPAAGPQPRLARGVSL